MLLSLHAMILSIAISVGAAAEGRGEFQDVRDGYTYRTVRLGGLEWLAENLKYRTPDSRCYDDDQSNCAKYGRLYRIQDAIYACPAGWHVPTEDDWEALERHLGMSKAEIGKISLRGVEAAKRLLPGGDTGFDSEFPGWYDAHLGKYQKIDENVAYWASTETRPQIVWHRDLSPTRGGIWRSEVDTSYWLSARCVRPASAP